MLLSLLDFFGELSGELEIDLEPDRAGLIFVFDNDEECRLLVFVLLISTVSGRISDW